MKIKEYLKYAALKIDMKTNMHYNDIYIVRNIKKVAFTRNICRFEKTPSPETINNKIAAGKYQHLHDLLDNHPEKIIKYKEVFNQNSKNWETIVIDIYDII